MQLSYNDRTQKHHQAIDNQLQTAPSITYIDAEQASAITNVTIQHSARYFPLCGCLRPQSLWQKLGDHANITVINNILIESLVQSNDSTSWLLEGVKNPPQKLERGLVEDNISWTQRFNQVVIANAADASCFEQTRWLPTKPVL